MIKFIHSDGHTINAGGAGPKLNGEIIDLKGAGAGGGYSTALPISPLEYRQKSPTKARALMEEYGDFVRFTIYSDWGNLYILEIENIHAKEIRAVKNNLAQNRLLT